MCIRDRVQVVVQGDFIGVVADREEQAEAAMRALKVRWKPVPPAPALDDLASACLLYTSPEAGAMRWPRHQGRRRSRRCGGI